jgi:2-dehydropantoate 2-reductase
MKYAIYGAGSLGTVMGAYLTKNDVDIELVNHNAQHIDALCKNGAHITGTVDFTVPVKAIFPYEMQGPYDVIFLMTKQLENAKTVQFLAPLLSPDGVIATLQNGIPEPGIAELIGAGRTVGVVVEWGAELTGPGVSRLTSSPDALSFHMGGMEGVPEEKLEQIKSLLEHMCQVHTEENLIGARWSKLLINATFSGIGTVLGGTFGDVSNDKLPCRLAVRCMKECIDSGRASGIVFAPVQGKNITRLFYYKHALKRRFAEFLVPIAMKKHADIVPSMLQDIRRGKKCEIDAINGVVCETGKKFGVPTPVNDRIRDTVKMIEEGHLAPAAGNIEFFKDLIK